MGQELVHGVLETVETELKYAGYITQQRRQVERLRDSEGRDIPVDFSYSDIPGLSREVQEKLERVRPETLGQAGQIAGITACSDRSVGRVSQPAAIECSEICSCLNGRHSATCLKIRSRSLSGTTSY